MRNGGTFNTTGNAAAKEIVAVGTELDGQLAVEHVEEVGVVAVDVQVGAVAAGAEARPRRVQAVVLGEDLDAAVGRVADDLPSTRRDHYRSSHARSLRSAQTRTRGAPVTFIETVPALHSGFRPPLGPTAQAIGFVIHGTRSVYFAGDTDLFDAMTDVATGVDVALLPVWGWGPTLGRGLHMDPLRAAEAVRRLRPGVAVPIHWGTYWPHAMGRVFPERLVEPPAALVEYAAELAPDVRVLPTEVGTPVALPWR